MDSTTILLASATAVGLALLLPAMVVLPFDRARNRTPTPDRFGNRARKSEPAPPDSLYAADLKKITGRPLHLETLRGHVVLVMNKSSVNAYRRQVAELHHLEGRFRKRGLRVLECGSFWQPLMKWLTDHSPDHNAYDWQCDKFIVSPQGEVLAAFDASVTPESPLVVMTIEEALQEAA